MQVKLLLFGKLVDIIGNQSLTIENIPDTNGLVQYLHQCYPVLNTTNYMIAVDKKTIRDNTLLHEGTTIALLPPFSGG